MLLAQPDPHAHHNLALLPRHQQMHLHPAALVGGSKVTFVGWKGCNFCRAGRRALLRSVHKTSPVPVPSDEFGLEGLCLCCAVLCCLVFCCLVLCCVALRCVVLCCVLCCVALRCVVLCFVLRCVALHCGVLCGVVWCGVLCCAVLCCAVLSCDALCCVVFCVVVSWSRFALILDLAVFRPFTTATRARGMCAPQSTICPDQSLCN